MHGRFGAADLKCSFRVSFGGGLLRGTLPFIGSHDLAYLFVIYIFSHDVLDFVHGPDCYRQRLATESVSPSTIRHSSLNLSRYFLVDLSYLWVIPSRLIGCFALVILVVNWAKKFLETSLKLVIEPFGRPLNHLITGSTKVIGKALHRTASAAPSKFILASKAVRCSWGSLVPSYFMSVGCRNL